LGRHKPTWLFGRCHWILLSSYTIIDWLAPLVTTPPDVQQLDLIIV
jgi:hypothetical protein